MHRFRFVLILVASVFTAFGSVHAADDAKKPTANQPKFELRDGDRVVFLGNTLIERAQKYGYWETMLTARYPNKSITFRNLGWSGDTVWADSRGMFDPPAVGYKRMIEHVTRLKPTVIFVGYGNNEAFAGKAGLPAFIKQYNTLLDDLTKVSAKGVRLVVLSPVRIPQTTPPYPNRKKHNLNLQLYRNSLHEISRDRSAFFVDLYGVNELHDRRMQRIQEWRARMYFRAGIPFHRSVISRNQPLTDQAWHATDSGHERISYVLDGELYPRSASDVFDKIAIAEITAEGKVSSKVNLRTANIKTTNNGLSAEIVCRFPTRELWLSVSDLAPGNYVIKVDGQVIEKTDNVKLAKTIRVFENDKPGPSVVQYEKLRQTIIAKNILYFYSWRPQNITYLTGFRKHEQGQNAKEIAEFDKLIVAKEKEINKLKKPVAHTYEIIRVKEDK
jgi:hypothetical protein